MIEKKAGNKMNGLKRNKKCCILPDFPKPAFRFWVRVLNLEKDVFCLVMSVGQKKNSGVCLKNQTSDLQIMHSNALPMSHRDCTVS